MSTLDPVTPASLVEALTCVELKSTGRSEAIAELVGVVDCESLGVSFDSVVAAVEEREATAQTVVTKDLAIPHASINWDGSYQVVLGRSRKGISFGATSVVHLVVLVITGRNHPKLHLQVLAAIAELLRDGEFRQRLIRASAIGSLQKLLADFDQSLASRKGWKLPELSQRLTEQAVQLATALQPQAILLAVDRLSSVPWSQLEPWNGRVLIVSTNAKGRENHETSQCRVFEVPHAGLSRIDRVNLGMLLATSNGLLPEDSDVVCITGPPGERLDCIAVIRPADKFHAIFQSNIEHGTARIPPAVILRVISLAIELASEGREGKAVGTMFVIGDTRQVERRSRQLVLNPFHGFSRRIRNVVDPGLAETIKEYASLDGAFIISADGTMLSAGTYLIPEEASERLTGGLGARHQAAASITARTKAMAIAVSQSTGKVTVFQNGGSVLSLERSSLTRW